MRNLARIAESALGAEGEELARCFEIAAADVAQSHLRVGARDVLAFRKRVIKAV